jgi:N6-adenosine-specific RNA methylase IME4
MIKIDPEFQGLLAKLDPDELHRLEMSIEAEGVRDPLVLWGETLVDGHNRLNIAERLGMPYETVQLNVEAARESMAGNDPDGEYAQCDDRTVVIFWIINNQIGKRNVHPFQRCEYQMMYEHLLPGGKKGGDRRSEDFNCQNSDNRKPTDRKKEAAKLTGVSHDTYAKAKAIKERANKLSPSTLEDLRAGRASINGAYKELKRVERHESQAAKIEDLKAREVQPPDGLYDVIVIDPPWPMEKIERECRPNQVAFDYPTMTIGELSVMDIPAADDCHMWLWTTHRFLPDAFRLLADWGFKYTCVFVWHKPGGFQPVGLPQFNCEFALYARKGSPLFADTKALNACFDAPRGVHSEKPDAFYDVVRRVTAGRRVDMFNRREIKGFDAWGNEA